MTVPIPIRLELPTTLPVGTVNAYLFIEPEPILVDAGVRTAECWDELTRGLAAHGLASRDLSQVVVTHAHVDHFGLAARLAEESGAVVRIAEPGVVWVTAAGDMWQKRINYYRDDFLPHAGLTTNEIDLVLNNLRVLDTLAEPVPEAVLRPFAVDGQLVMGGATWQVIHAPGHASMQTCFFEPDSGQFLAADMLLAQAPTPVVEPPFGGSNQRVPALPQFLASLDRLEPLPIGRIYPGHGESFGDHLTLIRRYRARIQDRQQECLALVCAGVDTIPALVEHMYASQPRSMRLVALWMLVGYLDVLQAQGLVVQTTAGGIWHYHAA